MKNNADAVVKDSNHIWLGLGAASIVIIGAIVLTQLKPKPKVDLSKFDSSDIKGSGKCMDTKFIKMLQKLAKVTKLPIFDMINSGARSSYWNAKVGGVSNSSHKIPVCKAADINAPTRAIIPFLLLIYSIICILYYGKTNRGRYTTELRSLVNQQTKLLPYQRAKALLWIKQGKVSYTCQLAKKLKRERKTIYNWLKLYEQEGIISYLKIKSRGARVEQIPNEVKRGISEQLSNPTTTITSYIELLDWVNTHYDLAVNYKTLYSHCRTHHKSVLKVARKSHHKKDDQAVEAFKKTT